MWADPSAKFVDFKLSYRPQLFALQRPSLTTATTFISYLSLIFFASLFTFAPSVFIISYSSGSIAKVLSVDAAAAACLEPSWPHTASRFPIPLLSIHSLSFGIGLLP